MKLNKLIAALSAVTILGGMAVVPAMAETTWTWDTYAEAFSGTAYDPSIVWHKFSGDSQNGTWELSDEGILTITNHDDDPNDGNNAALYGVSALIKNIAPDATYTISFYEKSDISNISDEGHGFYVNTDTIQTTESQTDASSLTKVATTRQNISHAYNMHQAEVSDEDWEYHSFTWQCGSGLDSDYDTLAAKLTFLFRSITGTVQVKDLKIEGPSGKNIATTNITTEPSHTNTLYKGESVTFNTVLNPEYATDAVTYKFTDSKNDDVTTMFLQDENDPNTFTYNNEGRPDGGNITVTASSGTKTATTQINVQRLRHISYKIEDKSGEQPTMNVVATVNNIVTAYNESVTYYTDDNDNTNDEQHGSDNSYSGHSNYSMTFTVPDGYILNIDDKDNYKVETSGNTVTVTNDADLDNDFYVTGTLKKATTFNTDYFSFNIPDSAYSSSGEITFNTAVINVTQDNVQKTGTATLSTTITAKKGTGLYVNITGVPNGVKVNSITLK